jgi:hypothetical protein
MKRAIKAYLMPPAAVYHYGPATNTAAPIAVFWLAGLISIGYGLAGGLTSQPSASWLEILLGVVIWAVAGAWARLVITGVEHDARHLPDSTLDHTVEPHATDPDPLKVVRREP